MENIRKAEGKGFCGFSDGTEIRFPSEAKADLKNVTPVTQIFTIYSQKPALYPPFSALTNPQKRLKYYLNIFNKIF